MEERRTSPRYNAAYSAETVETNARELVCLEDISKGGVSFRTEDRVKEDQGVNLRLFLRNRMFELKAVVVYVKRMSENTRSVGARFLAPPQEFTCLLEKEIEEISERQKEQDPAEGSDTFRRASLEYQKRRIF